MGTIAQEITRLQTAKSDLKTSIEAKGVQVPSGALISTYSGYVDQITGGGTTITPFEFAQYLFYYGRMWEMRNDLLNAFTGTYISGLATYISDPTRCLTQAEIKAWINKALSNADQQSYGGTVYIGGMLDYCTAYVGQNLVFDFSDYTNTNDINISGTTFNFYDNDRPSKISIKCDNTALNSTNPIMWVSSTIFSLSKADHLEFSGVINPSITSMTLINNNSSMSGITVDKFVTKRVNNNTPLTVNATQVYPTINITTLQNSLSGYANNVAPVTIKLKSSLYNEVAGTQLESDFNTYNVTFST